MGFDLSYRCVKCDTKMNASEIRALPNGKGFICRKCHAANSGTKMPLKGTNSKLSSQPKISPITSKEEFFQKREYICNHCSYTFSRNAEQHVKKCPYCGEYAVEEKINLPANELVKRN